MSEPAPGRAGWTRVTVTVDLSRDPAAAEVAAGLLWQAGAAGVEEQGEHPDLALVGGFADPEAAGAAADRARSLGLAVAIAPIDDHGLEAWRPWATAERAGRFWITPTWVDAPVLAAGEEVLWIDPGPTFGSGSHPTTRLTLAALGDLVTPGSTVLDVGCGSGVLAVGAALSGAAATATDIDPGSPEVVAANAVRNGVGAAVHVTTDSPADLAATGRRYDVVAANLLAPVIRELGADLVRCVAPGGALVISGLLAERWQEALPAVAPLAVDQVRDEGGWVAVVLR